MTRDEKIELHHQILEIERAVTSMNGPYVQTGKIVTMLATLREAWMEDAIFSGCEMCGDPILESEMDSAVSSDDGCWFCASCASKWNDQEVVSDIKTADA